MATVRNNAWVVQHYLSRIDNIVTLEAGTLGLTEQQQREAQALISGLQSVLFPEPKGWCAGSPGASPVRMSDPL
jgi:hypothetical protein